MTSLIKHKNRCKPDFSNLWSLWFVQLLLFYLFVYLFCGKGDFILKALLCSAVSLKCECRLCDVIHLFVSPKL